MSEILKNTSEQSTPFDALRQEEFGPDKTRGFTEDTKPEQQEENREETKTKLELCREHLEKFKHTAEELIANDFGNLSEEDSINRTLLFCDIMNAESDKRHLEEKRKRDDEYVVDQLKELETNYEKKGPIRRFFGESNYEDQKRSLELLRRAVQSLETSYQEQRIAEKLPEYYGEEVKDENGKIDSEKLQELNDRFFGKNDPARAEKINSALADYGSSDVLDFNKWIMSLGNSLKND